MVEKKALTLFKERDELREKAKKLYVSGNVVEARELSQGARKRDKEALELLKGKTSDDNDKKDIEIDYLLNI